MDHFQISRHVTVANSDAKMHSAYRPRSIVTVFTIVPMKVTKQIVRQSHVPTINSYVRVADRTVHQNAFRRRNCAMVSVTVKMAPMRKPLAVSTEYRIDHWTDKIDFFHI